METIYRIECKKTGLGPMHWGHGVWGIGNFMCERGLYGPYSVRNDDIDYTKDEYAWQKGDFFFTEEGWKKVGFPLTRKLNAHGGVPYRVVRGVPKDERSVLYRDRLQVVVRRKGLLK